MSVFYRVIGAPIFTASVLEKDGATIKRTAYDNATDWLNEHASAGYSLASPVVVRGNEARCKLDSGCEGSAVVFSIPVPAPKTTAPKGPKS